jgi:hypothetical protein
MTMIFVLHLPFGLAMRVLSKEGKKIGCDSTGAVLGSAQRNRISEP